MKAITLDWFELMQAGMVGLLRQCNALRDGRKDAHGLTDRDSNWNTHIEGACGERAVAKAVNRYWNGSVDTFKSGGDVGAKIQVRTRSQHDYELLVRDSDPDDAAFFLVTGWAPHYRVIGWIMGRDAKRAEWKQTHGGRPAAYFVPHAALTALE